MENQTNQASEIRDQPNELNLCPCCGGVGKIVSYPEKNEHSIACECGHQVFVYYPTLDEYHLQVLTSMWNMSLVQKPLSQKAQETLMLSEGSLLVFDLQNYVLLKSFKTFLDAITYMEQRFNEDLTRTSLFQLREDNQLEYIMVSDDLWEDLTDWKL